MIPRALISPSWRLRLDSSQTTRLSFCTRDRSSSSHRAKRTVAPQLVLHHQRPTLARLLHCIRPSISVVPLLHARASSHDATRLTCSSADSSSLAPVQPTSSARAFHLRPYQIDCLNTILKTLSATSISRLGVSSPTGSGKTAIFTELIPRLPPRIHPDTRNLAKRVLVLVGSIQLAKQAAKVIKWAYPEMVIEIEQGDNEASGFADVTVATFQTLSRGEFTRLDKFDPTTFKAVIVDEAHHAAARSYIEILNRFDPRISAVSDPPAIGLDDDLLVTSPILPSTSVSTEMDPPHLDPLPFAISPEGELCVPILAFTATFSRADGLALGKVVEKIVWHASWLDMIESGWLSEVKFTTVRLGSALDMSSISTSKTSGDFVIASLALAIDQSPINALCIKAWREKAEGKRRSTLVFAVNINHVVSLTNEFRNQGIDARFVHEDVKVKEREQTYDAFKRGEFEVLVNCSILTEGADFPFIDCILLARPTKSRNLFQQMIGRGMRKSPSTGKEDCLMIDLVGNSTQGIVCTPTLFGIDPNLAIEAQSTKNLQELSVSSPAPQTDVAFSQTFDTTLAYEEFNTVSAFLSSLSSDDAPQRIPLSRLSRNAWVGIGNDAYVLDLIGKGYIRISRAESIDAEKPSKWEAKGYRRLPSAFTKQKPFSTSYLLGSHSDLKILFSTIDALTANSEKWKPANSVARYAAWRSHDSTPAQHKIIRKKLAADLEDDQVEGVWVPGRETEEWVGLDELSRGEACDLISRVMHGGIGELRRVKKKVDRRMRTRRR